MSHFWILTLVLSLWSCSKVSSEPNYEFSGKNPNGLAVEVGDIKVTEKEITSGIETDIYDLEQKIFETKFDKVKSILIEKMMESDPNKKGLTNDQYLEKYIASSIKISDKQIDDFIKEKNIPQEHINPQIKERVKSFLEMEERKKAVETWLAKKLDGKTVKIFFQKPARPVFDVKVGDAPSWGDEKSKVTIIEFSDFQCPYCAKGAEIISQIKKEFKGKVRVVFKQFPLPFHTNAKKAAEASLCAHEQSAEAFWKFHDEMFANQSKLSIEDLKALAGKHKLKTEQFNQCLDSGKYTAKVEAEMKEGQDVGVKSTPTFFVNGQIFNGALPIETFREVINSELK